MGRPASVNTEQILRVARELFLAQGYGVTTAAIARSAGISEGSIFKRFPTKDELFFAALGIPEPTWIAEIPGLAGQHDPQRNLEQIVQKLIAFFRELLPRMIMLWSNRGVAVAPPFLSSKESPPSRGLAALIGYFGREAELGRTRACKPEALARLLLGAAQNYVFFELYGVCPVGPALSAQEFAANIAETLWLGMKPPNLVQPVPQRPTPTPRKRPRS